MKKSIEISVVVPMFNEKDTIMELYSQISEVMEKTKKSWEFVIVDDGSTDQTPEMIRELAKKDDRVRPVIFARNFGQQAAVKAGLDYSRGEGVVVIDADLQDPPEVILELIEKWEEGYEVIYAQRTEREGESFLKLLTAKMFYATIQRLTDINMPMNTGFFRLLDRKVVDVINQLPEKNRFFRGLSIWVGFKQIAVPYKRKARFAGETKYPFSKMFKLAITAITGFSFFPLQVAMYLGFISSGIAIITIPVVIIMRMLGNQAFLGQASTLIAVLFLGGVQLVSLGIIGEYIGRIFISLNQKPQFVISEKN